jgi:hypothetical protein
VIKDFFIETLKLKPEQIDLYSFVKASKIEYTLQDSNALSSDGVFAKTWNLKTVVL